MVCRYENKFNIKGINERPDLLPEIPRTGTIKKYNM